MEDRLNIKGIFTLDAELLRIKQSEENNISAVIVPFVHIENKWYIIFEKKSTNLNRHGGQISFPGGIMDEKDANILETAIRETCEEIRVCKNELEIVGNLHPTKTLTTNYTIYPFVGIVKKPPPYYINKKEVEKIITVPLNFLIKNYPIKERNLLYNGKVRKTLLIQYKGENIWGATARILNELLSKLV